MNALPNFTMENHKFIKTLSVWTSETRRESVTYTNVQTSFFAYRLDLDDRDISSNRKMSLQPSQSCLFASILIITRKRKTLFIIVTRIKEQWSYEFHTFRLCYNCLIIILHRLLNLEILNSTPTLRLLIVQQTQQVNVTCICHRFNKSSVVQQLPGYHGNAYQYKIWRPQMILVRQIAVGIATRYGLEGPGIEFRWGQDFPQLSKPALGPTQPPIQRVPGLSWG